jgi:LPS-assembly lipoprotein
MDRLPSPAPVMAPATAHRLKLSRRGLVLSALVAPLAACGFKLRGSEQMPFQTVALIGDPATPVVAALLEALPRSGVRWVKDPAEVLPDSGFHVVIKVLTDQRDRVVTGQTSAGLVREVQLRSRFQFEVQDRVGRVLRAPSEVAVQRDISYNEAGALAKQTEEAALYDDMANDAVRQILRRLGTLTRP